MHYCSNCGSGKVIYKIPEQDNFYRHECQACGSIHYDNPRIVVGCLPVYGDKILLARRAIEPRYGLWNLPAGYLEKGETVEEGAWRETKEETDADVELLRLHCVYNLPHANQVYMHFLARMHSQHCTPTTESLEVKLFEPSEIPWEDIAFSSTTFALKHYLDTPGYGVAIGSKTYK